MKTTNECKNCQVFGPMKSIKLDSKGNCVECGQNLMPQSQQFELTRAKTYLKISGLSWVPSKLKDHLSLSQTSDTLSRKFRQASTGNNPELLRSYYVNDKGRRIVEFHWNHDHKEEFK